MDSAGLPLALEKYIAYPERGKGANYPARLLGLLIEKVTPPTDLYKSAADQLHTLLATGAPGWSDADYEQLAELIGFLEEVHG